MCTHITLNVNDVINSCFIMPTDIDECTSGVSGCHKLASCKNTEGSYICSCQPPYIGDGKNCTLGVTAKGNKLFYVPSNEKHNFKG